MGSEAAFVDFLGKACAPLSLCPPESPKIISDPTKRTCLQFRKTLHLNSSAVFSGAAILAMHPTTPSQLLSTLSAIIRTHAKTQFPGLQVHALNNLYFFSTASAQNKRPALCFERDKGPCFQNPLLLAETDTMVVPDRKSPSASWKTRERSRAAPMEVTSLHPGSHM